MNIKLINKMNYFLDYLDFLINIKLKNNIKIIIF